MIVSGASWCDLVKYADGRVELVALHGTTVACAQRWAVDAGQAWLYLRAAADGGGRVLALGQRHTDGQAWATIEGGAPFFLGPTHGVFPVLVTGRDEGWVCFVQHYPDAYMRIVLDADGWEVERTVTTMPATSQGFLYLSSDGRPVTQDAGRHAIAGLALPSPAGDVWVGQSTTAATLALFDRTTSQITPLNTPGGQPPHVVESGGTYFVCSYVDGGAWLSTHQRPFGGSPPPPVEPPPEEEPVQKPGINVVRFDPVLSEHGTWELHVKDRHRPGVEFKVKFVNGDLRVEWTNDGWGPLSDFTGSRRHVDIKD
jgi:hypothetical protein